MAAAALGRHGQVDEVGFFIPDEVLKGSYAVAAFKNFFVAAFALFGARADESKRRLAQETLHQPGMKRQG